MSQQQTPREGTFFEVEPANENSLPITNARRQKMADEIIQKIRSGSALPNGAMRLLEKPVTASPRLVAELLEKLTRDLAYDSFQDLVALFKIYEADFLKNPNALLQAAFAAWVRGFHEESVRWSKNLVCLAPNHPSGYLRLGLCYLTTQKFVDAFLALSAGLRNTNNNPQLNGWFALAQKMALDQREVVFQKFGKTFRFQLTCFNGQAMESDAAHLAGRFTEEAELEFLATALVGCKNIVEIGALVGNHTVFLASFIQPEKYLVVDALDSSIQETKRNVEANRSNFPHTVFDFVQTALGAKGGQIVEIGGKKVTTQTLEELLPDDVDFLKIDIDGMEGPLLEPLLSFLSKRSVKLFIEVEARFLASYFEKTQGIGYKITRIVDHGAYSNLFLEKNAGG
jgi:tetratricopeptide (TPR) repeat protein